MSLAWDSPHRTAQAGAFFAAVGRLAAVRTAAERISVILDALAASGIETGSVLLFRKGGITRMGAFGERAFLLRDDSVELRRLFLHALDRFAIGGVYFVPKERTKSFAGVSAARGDSGILFIPLDHENERLGMIALHRNDVPNESELHEIGAFAHACSDVIAMTAELARARRTLREAQVLSAVSERMRHSPEPHEILDAIAESIAQVFSARSFAVHTVPVPGNDDLRRAFAGSCVRSLTGDSSYVPLGTEGKVEAVIGLTFDSASALADDDLNALRTAASYGSLALANVALYERERARGRRAEALEKIVRILRDSQYVDEVLAVFVVTASHELHTDCAAYSLDAASLVLRAGRTLDLDSNSLPIRFEREPLEPSLGSADPSDAPLLPRAIREQLFGDEAGVIVPLHVEGALWGMLTFGRGALNTDWNVEDRILFVRTLALHVEIALANANAYEREARRAQERERLAEAARAMLRYAQEQPPIGLMCDTALTLVSGEAACALRWMGTHYDVVAESGDTEHLLAHLPFPLDRPIAIEATTRLDERRVLRVLEGPGFALIPLTPHSSEIVDEMVEAALVVGRSDERRFSRDELRILHELGALLSLALRNSELFEQTREANRALSESSLFKDDLLAMLAHDFKAPLTVILGYCELLGENAPPGEEIEMIGTQARRLVRLSDDALVLARSQAEGFSLARQRLDLRTFVQDAVARFGTDAARIVVEVADQSVEVAIDPQRFAHVLDNLVSNGLKYSSDIVTLRVFRDHADALVTISDRGIGIPASEIDTLFTRFRRASNARDRGISGTGVGLYVSRKIVDVHGGAISVASVENEGSTFTVRLPATVSSN